MLTIWGLTASQMAIYAVVGVALLLLAAWNFGAPVLLHARRWVSRVRRPTALDSDRRAPVGAHQWMHEVLTALDGAPADLKLDILCDPHTTVATALQRHCEYLKTHAP